MSRLRLQEIHMKKFIIACTAVIIAVICWMFVSDRIGSTLSFNMNKEVKTFTTVSDKETCGYWERNGTI